MTALDAIILGIVEGITEFLPISSTGHLILTTDLLHVVETDFVKTFIIVIQLGAILAAAVLYWRRLLLDPRTLAITIVAFIPTGFIGFVLYKVIKGFLGNPAIVMPSVRGSSTRRRQYRTAAARIAPSWITMMNVFTKSVSTR